MERSVRRWSWCASVLSALLAVGACGDDGEDEKGKETADAGIEGDDGDMNAATDGDEPIDVPDDEKPTGEFKWFMLCGDPFCSEGAGHTPHAGVALCEAKEGEPCAYEGQVCDPVDPCNANMKCAKTDPKPAEGCPMY